MYKRRKKRTMSCVLAVMLLLCLTKTQVCFADTYNPEEYTYTMSKTGTMSVTWNGYMGISERKLGLKMTCYPSSQLKIEYKYYYFDIFTWMTIPTEKQYCVNQGLAVKNESVNVFSQLDNVWAKFYAGETNVWEYTLRYKR